MHVDSPSTKPLHPFGAACELPFLHSSKSWDLFLGVAPVVDVMCSECADPHPSTVSQQVLGNFLNSFPVVWQLGPKTETEAAWACREVTGHGGEEWLALGILPELGTPHVTEVGFFRLVAP